MDKVLVSHKSDHWATPSHIYKWFMDAGFYDPCPLNADFDGLKRRFSRFTFVNPPYSNISAWVDYAIAESKRIRYSVIVLLLPARTDTQWFKKLYDYEHAYFQFFIGRLKFGDSKVGAPFPSMLVYLDRDGAMSPRFQLIGTNEYNVAIDHYITYKETFF